VRLRARLQKLSAAWRLIIADDRARVTRWTAAHYEQLARLPEDVQERLAKAFAKEYSTERWTSAQLGEWIERRELRRFTSMKWHLDDAALVKAAGSCIDCAKRSSASRGLFEDLQTSDLDDHCLDGACYAKKLAAFLKAKAEALKAEHGGFAIAENYGQKVPGAVKKLATGGTVKDWAINDYKAKPGQVGAVPVLEVSGENAGEVRWYKPAKAAVGAAPETPEDRKAREESEQRERLRAEFVEERLREALDERKAPPKGWSKDWQLAAILVAQQQVNGGSAMLLSTAEGLVKKGEKTVRSALWAQVAVLLAESCWSSKDAPAVLEFIGLDVKALRKEAAEKFPAA